jgi:Bacterial regulatory proteins, luxR family
VLDHPAEIYGGLIAATFAVLGIWLGLKLTAKQKEIVLKEVPAAVGQPFVPDGRKREHLSITPRELEILQLIAKRMSNREIAEKLYVSETGADGAAQKVQGDVRQPASQHGDDVYRALSDWACDYAGLLRRAEAKATICASRCRGVLNGSSSFSRD